MLVDYTAFSSATHWWVAERVLDSECRLTKDEELQERLHRAARILPFLFQTLNSFYLVTRVIPLQWAPQQKLSVQDGGTNNIVINMKISPEHYQTLRITLALVSDIYSFSNAIIKIGKSKLNGLKSPTVQLFDNANQFRDVRNFFTHFDVVLLEPDKHGITGPVLTNCGIEYTNTAKGGLHLILSGDKLYFTWHRKVNEVNIGKKAFDGIFISAMNVYSEIISHKLHATQYPSPDSIYPI